MTYVKNQPRYHAFAARVSGAAMSVHKNQTEVAGECGVTPQSAQRWFSGTSIPRPQHLPALAAALDMTVEELIDGIPELSGVVRMVADAHTPHNHGGRGDQPATPVLEMERLSNATKEMNSARVAYHRALLAAVDVAKRALTEELMWEGYMPVEQPSADPSSELVVSKDGELFLVVLRVTLPSPADTARVNVRSPGAPPAERQFIAYAFLNNGALSFFIIPSRYFTEASGRPIVKAAATWMPDEDEAAEMPTEIESYIDNFNLLEIE